VYAHHDFGFKSILNSADIALPDGIGVLWAGQRLARQFKERITGTDLMLELCKRSVEQHVSIGLLGGGKGVAEKAADCLRAKYPGINITFATSEFNNYKGYIDILFVAFGHPKQEQWIHSQLDKLPVTAAMGVGGAFDYISGNIARAPKFIRSLGLEWLYRLVRQPWRWKRQLALWEFIWLVLKEKRK
jgi:N-acetylglucosaminyldiphosphoundecaprenol N-acetyl-beta-D-mannosaminyltransferase